MSRADPVRQVLADLISESRAPYTPEGILREFRATSERRLPLQDLLCILVNISGKRPNFNEVTAEVTDILQRKDPMYALLVFSERYSQGGLSSRSNASSEMTSSLGSKFSLCSSSDNSSAPSTGHSSAPTTARSSGPGTGSSRISLPQAQDIPTSTPVSRRSGDFETSSAGGGGGGVFTRRPSSQRSTVSSKEDRDRGDLSVIKERVLSAVSNRSLNSYRLLTSDPASSRANIANGSGAKTPTHSVVAPSGLPEEDRTHLLWDYYKVDGKKLQKPEIAALPVTSQQNVMLRELLHCLTGVRESSLVPLQPDHTSVGLAKFETTFAIHMQLDRSLAELVQDILPLASFFMGIQKIVTTTDGQGQVVNSLNEALQELAHDYYLLIVQADAELKHKRLTLQKLLYYLQPTIWVMEEIWTSLVDIQLSNHCDAAVLTYLHERIKRLEGDRQTQRLIIGLARKAAEPYMRMLKLWIQKGTIVDRNQEFLVEDNEVIHRDELPEHYSDDYWEKRYSIRRGHIPSFLEKFSDKILRTGKYLNVIRQCGKRVMPTQEMRLEYDPTSELHVSVINDAYYFAARMLLDVLLAENDLMGHLQSVKRYLLLNQGDFTMQFMDACEDELSKNVDQVLPMTLENLLGLTLRLSSARNDPYKDDLHCELLPYDLVTQMSKIMNQKEEYWQSQHRLDLSGIECFAFTYEVKWPVSLVLNHIAISKYQMLFRQLFYCKHVERQLCKIWKENSIAKRFSPQAAELYRSAFTLRQRMMNAIQNLEYYMMIEIIEPNWHIFIEKMKKVENVDNVLLLHQDFLDSCLKNCMLTESSEMNRSIFKLCNVCLKFCDFIQRSQRFFLDAELKSMVCDTHDSADSSESEPESSHRPQVQLETSLDPADTFSERVNRFDLEFTGLLISFLKQINTMAKKNTADRFMNLVHRINFNAFYSDQMDKLCVKDAMV
ncbi:gamma-tubulin complex component 2 homolog isoform X1 [Drosophila subpulchrella]|uniref:gamma-tubulin complex component 2 homolog isoform X1 n=1 Tax=Drosophila subpulchrella TaxID=1486046 RepID=UPI0018A19A91|nr:gamma-tubulin complex component 2 homolog isoform X1 [Drosophila subpulchrella]